jgi:tetratricopeptide (TPR) repeat protein
MLFSSGFVPASWAAPVPSKPAVEDVTGRGCLGEGTDVATDPDHLWPQRLLRNPDDLEALREMVRVCLDRGKIWAALAFADRTAAHARASTADQEASNLRAGEMRLYLGYFPDAAKNFKRVLKLNKEHARSYRLLAETLRAHPAQALVYAKKAAQVKNALPAERVAAYLLAGDLHIDLAQRPAAEKAFSKALDLAPKDLDVLYAMVRVKRDKKRAALRFAKQAQRVASQAPLWQRPAAYRVSARIWLELQEVTAAAENLHQALALNPYDLDALVTLVQHKKKLSAKELGRLQRHNPAKPRKTPLLSEEKSANALARDPNDLEALRSLITRRHEQKKRLEAVAYAERFMRSVWRTPLWQQPEAYRLMARLWVALGYERRAFACVDRALDIQPDSVETMDMIIELEKQGGVGDTVEEGEAASLSYIYYNVAKMRLELKDLNRAQESLQRAVALKKDIDPAGALHRQITQALRRQ